MSFAVTVDSPARQPCHGAVRRRVWGKAGVSVLAVTHALALGAAAPSATPEYVDKLIPGAPKLPDVADDGPASFDGSGMPRALRIESRVQSSSNDQGRESSAWVNLRGAIDTANYGALSLDGSARLLEQTTQQRRGAGASFSLYQTAMPFAGGWYATQGLGVIQTLGPKLAAQQASFFVPSRLVQGVSTQWSNEASGLTLQLSGGETGSFSSIGRGSFYGSGDRVAAVGLHLQRAGPHGATLLPAGWSYSALASSASGSSDQVVPGYGVRQGEAGGSGLFQSLRWESARSFVQGNVLASRSEGLGVDSQGVSDRTRSSRLGAWLDGASQAGEVTHRWGAHHLAPSLNWQGTALGGNSEGAYYRWSQIGLRTQIEAQLAATQPLDRSTGSTALTQVGVSVRRYVDQQLGIGGVIQLSHAGTTALQVSGYAELHRPWADVRTQAGLEFDGGSITARRLSSDQAWALPIGQRLTTSQALTSTKARAQSVTGAVVSDYGTSIELAVAGGADVAERLSLDLNARASLPVSSQAARIYNVSASSQYRFASGWSLGAALGVSRASGLTSPATSSPIPSLPSTFSSYVYPSTSSRDFWLTLRYDFQAGSAPVPIGAGARIGAGGGNIAGVVYLDDNANGRLDALEARAANVTVTLDGRYTTRTDAQGRFDFPFVAPGKHVLMVVADTLPLPWVMPGGDPVRVEVAPRETTRIEIGATRDRLGASAE